MAKTGASDFDATVKELTWFADNTAALTLGVENRGELNFLPGPVHELRVPGTEAARSYSFSSGPAADELRFLIRTAPDGAMTTYLKERAAVGDIVPLTGPMGSFFLRDIKRPVLMLAGGTGIAPLLSMLEKIATGLESRRPIRCTWPTASPSTRTSWSWTSWSTTPARSKSFTFDYCVADKDSTAKKGYVTQHITAEQLNDGDVDVYLCGPPAMVDAVRNYWDAQGITPGQLLLRDASPWEARADRRWPGPPREHRRARAISPGRFAGKVVVVTGAAQGIGRAVAERVAAEGADTFLVDRAELVREAAAELAGRTARRRSPSPPTLRPMRAPSAAIDAALARHGRIDVLINNVGGTIWAKPFEHYEPEEISQEIQRSLFPTLWTCRAVLPHMISQRRGVIVNVPRSPRAASTGSPMRRPRAA